jgi:molecular chaperone DnaK (HSP70)
MRPYEPTTLDLASMTLESKSDLVIGIDFGTTFTGVAYAHSAQTYLGDAKKVAETVHVIKSWPSPNSSYMDKIPSVLAYNTNPPTWGGGVKARDQPQVAHFKLGLQPNARDYYLRGSSESKTSALAFLESDWSHPQLPGKKAVDFAADYLTRIHTYVKDDLFSRQFGKVFLQNQQFSYVITVPAIWKDSAKALTREAATRAGIPNQKLELITEPEAAALYCATICDEVDLVVGDRFLVCDAGGGTVVSA